MHRTNALGEGMRGERPGRWGRAVRGARASSVRTSNRRETSRTCNFDRRSRGSWCGCRARRGITVGSFWWTTPRGARDGFRGNVPSLRERETITEPSPVDGTPKPRTRAGSDSFLFVRYYAWGKEFDVFVVGVPSPLRVARAPWRRVFVHRRRFVRRGVSVRRRLARVSNASPRRRTPSSGPRSSIPRPGTRTSSSSVWAPVRAP